MIYCKKDTSKQFKMTSQSLWVWSKPFDSAFVERVKMMPVRRYDVETRRWELPLGYLNDLIKAFPSINLIGANVEAASIGYNSIEEYEAYLKTLKIEADYTPKTEMECYQVEWFNKMLSVDRILNADPPGLGKTKEYLDVCEYRKQAHGYKKVLFICGSKYKYNMARQVRIHTNSQYMILDGVKKSRLNKLREYYFNEDIYYLIISYESAAIHAKELKLLGVNMGFDGCLVDECQKIKNYQEKKGAKGDKRHLTVKIVDLIESINPELLILGTGTPVDKKAEYLYTTLRLTGLETRSIWQFRSDYCIFDHFGTVVGYKNVSELSERLNQVMIRRPKELLHLTEPKPEFVALEMNPDQAHFYNACLVQLRSELKGTKAVTQSFMTKLLRLRQITSNPKLLDSEASSVKEDVVCEMVRGAAENGEKSVIFSIYIDEVKSLVSSLSDLNPAHIIGYMNAKKAQEEVEKFQDDPSCMVMVGSLMACKESYDMYAAKNVFLMDMSYNVNDDEQAIARVWRRGQTNSVNIYYLYCEKTIDEHVLGILANDKLLAEQILGTEGESVRLFDRELVNKILGL